MAKMNNNFEAIVNLGVEVIRVFNCVLDFNLAHLPRFSDALVFVNQILKCNADKLHFSNAVFQIIHSLCKCIKFYFIQSYFGLKLYENKLFL